MRTASNKIKKLSEEITFLEDKICVYQQRLKEVQLKKTEEENMQIVNMVRKINLTPQQLAELLHGQSVDPQEVSEDEE